MKEIILEKDKTPSEIKYKNKLITSAKEIANEYTEYLDEKIEGIRNSIQFQNFKAMSIFRKRIKKVEVDAKFSPVKIKEVQKILRGFKNSNARGNTEVTHRIVKTLWCYISVAMTHLANKIFSFTFCSAFFRRRIRDVQR